MQLVTSSNAQWQWCRGYRNRKEKNRKLDVIILHASPKKAELEFLEIGLSLIDKKDVLALPTRRNSINYVVSYGFPT